MDVVVVAERAVLPVWKFASSAIADKISASNHRVIVPARDIELFEEASDQRFSVESEEEYADQFSGELLTAMGGTNPDRYGWYLQQLIKLEALHRLAKTGSVGIIWDADTIPLVPITFLSGDELRFFKGTEYHLPYFCQIDRLLGLDKVVEFSFISQCFPCRPEWISKFVEQIELRHGTQWWTAVISTIDFRERSGFSEYETLGTFVSHHFPGEWGWHEGSWTRDGYARFGSPRRALGQIQDVDSPLHFAAFESWKAGPRRKTSKNLKTVALVLKAIQHRLLPVTRFTERPAAQFEETLKSVMKNPSLRAVVQIGANDGVQNDFLRPFLLNQKGLDITLVEPSHEYFKRLQDLYGNATQFNLVNAACGASVGEIKLWEIPYETAKQMNGNGPPNDWAMGQGSSSRATVVYWIWQNSFRGDAYTERIPEWISAIRSISVPVVLTDDVMPRTDGDVLMVVDVQGMELEVLQGLSLARLPRWIIVEEDAGDTSARHYLSELGFKLLVGGPNLFFERMPYEGLPERQCSEVNELRDTNR